jgi:hypothetical protein
MPNLIPSAGLGSIGYLVLPWRVKVARHPSIPVVDLDPEVARIHYSARIGSHNPVVEAFALQATDASARSKVKGVIVRPAAVAPGLPVGPGKLYRAWIRPCLEVDVSHLERILLKEGEIGWAKPSGPVCNKRLPLLRITCLSESVEYGESGCIRGCWNRELRAVSETEHWICSRAPLLSRMPTEITVVEPAGHKNELGKKPLAIAGAQTNALSTDIIGLWLVSQDPFLHIVKIWLAQELSLYLHHRDQHFRVDAVKVRHQFHHLGHIILRRKDRASILRQNRSTISEKCADVKVKKLRRVGVIGIVKQSDAVDLKERRREHLWIRGDRNGL